MNGARWTDEDLTKLFDLREQKKLKWPEIAWHFRGRNAKACAATYAKKRAQRLADAERALLPTPPEPVYRELWTDAETERLIQLRETGRRAWKEIDRVLCRRPGDSRAKYLTLLADDEDARTILVGVHMRQPTVSQRALDDRARRAALHPATITAMLLGDPLPGHSALDKRGHQSISKPFNPAGGTPG